jgi:integrase
MRLTDISIRGLKAPLSGQKTHFDESLRGFGLRVSQGGTKTFVVLLGKDRVRKTIGRYPDVSLADARKLAKRLLANAPIENLVRRAAVNFTDAKERFLVHVDAHNKRSTANEYRRLLNRHFRLDKPLSELTRQDVMRSVERLQAAPSEARHAFVAMRTMMNWCVRHGLIETSPVPRLSFATATRSRVLTDDELRKVWQRAIQVGFPYGRIIQLLILTGQRRGEVAALRRSWIESEEIVFPTGFTKNKREHRLPIGPTARATVASIDGEGDLLFPARGQTDRPFNGWSKCKRIFDHPLGIAPYTLHDLRRTFSSNSVLRCSVIGRPRHWHAFAAGHQYSSASMMVSTRTVFSGSLASSDPCSMSGA